MTRESLVAMLLLALVVTGAHPRQLSPAADKTFWHRDEHSLNNDILANWRNQALYGKAGGAMHEEQTRLAPVTQAAGSHQDLLGVCDCFVNHSARRTGCNYEIGVRFRASSSI